MPTVFDLAREYVGSGLSVVPIRADGTKKPDGTWKRFQLQLPTEEDVRRTFRDRHVGIAILGGLISGGLEILDFDSPELWNPWVDLVESGRPGLLNRLPVVQTPRGGYHVYLRSPEPEGNQILAYEMPSMKAMIETRGEGGYVLAPGCPPECHKTHLEYLLMEGPQIGDTPTLSREERGFLFDCARSFDQKAPAEILKNPAPTPPLPLPSPENPARRVGDDFNLRSTWEEILQPHGWTKAQELQNGEIHWTRPGKEARDGSSATTGHCKTDLSGDLLKIFSSNAPPFEAGKTYSKFSAYTLLNHAGNFRDSTRTLGDHGFGDARAPRNTNGTGGASLLPGPGEAGSTPPGEEPQEPQSSVFTTLNRLADMPKFEVPSYLLDGLIFDHCFTIIGGDPKARKSSLAISIALGVLTGKPVLERAILRTGPVAIVQADMGEGLFSYVLQALAKGMEISPESTLPHPISFHCSTSIDLQKPETRKKLFDDIAALQPALVLLDPLADLHSGSENKAEELKPPLDFCLQLRDSLGAAVILVDHLVKPQGQDGGRKRNGPQGYLLRGSGRKYGRNDTTMIILDCDDLVSQVSATHRYSAPTESLWFRYACEGDSAQLLLTERPETSQGQPDRRAETEAKIANFLKLSPGWHSIRQIQDGASSKFQTTKETLALFFGRNWIESDKLKPPKWRGCFPASLLPQA